MTFFRRKEPEKCDFTIKGGNPGLIPHEGSVNPWENGSAEAAADPGLNQLVCYFCAKGICTGGCNEGYAIPKP